MRFSVVAAAALCVFSFAAHANTFAFSYSGTDVTGVGGSSSGTGSISFGGDPDSLTLASLTSFSFTQTTFADNIGTPSTFAYTLSDLSSFSSTEVGDTLLTLMFQTEEVAASNRRYSQEAFEATSLLPGGAKTLSPFYSSLQVGTVTQAAAVTPEPSSFALLGTGLLGIAGLIKRKLA